MKICNFFDLNKSLSSRLLLCSEYPWDALDMLSEYILRIGRGLSPDKYARVRRGVWIAGDADVADSAQLVAPIIIDSGAQIDENTLLRASIIGKGAFIGRFSEITNTVVFDGVRAGQRNYIGDSIVGCGVSFGAGAIVSSRSSNGSGISLLLDGEIISCPRRRFGAVVGDGARIGCSSVLVAGCALECGASVPPLTRARGFISADRIYRGEKIAADML